MVSGPFLLILAAVGVDYGWQPDGTRSRGGDNLEYIIQIAPDQVGRLEHVGEITSVLDPRISSRVTKVVIRVGDGTLPRNAGDPISSSEESTLTPKEPRTGLNNERDSQSAIDSEKIATRTAITTTSRMKPPQQISNGIDFPSNLPSAVTASSEVSTEPINSNRTNQWAEIRNQATPPSLIVPPPPPTVTASDAPITPSPIASPTQIGFDPPSVVSWPPSQLQVEPKPYLGTYPTQISNSMPRPGSEVSTSPDDPTWSGYGRESSALSSLPKADEKQGPGELQVPKAANENKAFSTTPIGQQTVNPGQLQREPINGMPYTQGIQSISNTSLRSDDKGYWVDQYGRKLDQQGNLIADQQLGNRPESFGRNKQNLGTPTEYRRPEFASGPSSIAASGIRRNENLSRENTHYPANSMLGGSSDQLENTAISTQQSTIVTDHPPNTSLSTERDNIQPLTKAFSTESEMKSLKRVNAQPFFNFILLISLVGNAYLIYETGNLRRKFRSMVSAIRTTKITPQGA